MRSQSHTNYFSQYGMAHNKLGAMMDLSKPKYEIPLNRQPARHYNVLTGKRCSFVDTSKPVKCDAYQTDTFG